MDEVSADASPSSNFESYKNMMIAVHLTLLCGAIALCFYGQGVAPILDELELRMGWGIFDETRTETLEEKRRCYLDSEMCDVSDDECWRSTVRKKLRKERFYIYFFSTWSCPGFTLQPEGIPCCLGNLERSSCAHRCFDRCIKQVLQS